MKSDWLWDRKIDENEAKKILKNPNHKNFILLASLLFARKNDPKNVFKNYIDPLIFCRYWNTIKKTMRKDKWNEPRIIFWQAVYEKLKDKYHEKGIVLIKEIRVTIDPLCKEMGSQISQIRQAQNLSQKELAKKLGVSQQLISRIEKGKENVSLTTLNNLSRALSKKVKIDFI